MATFDGDSGLLRGESLPTEVGSFPATIRGRLRRHMNTAPLDLVVNDEAYAWARGHKKGGMS